MYAVLDREKLFASVKLGGSAEIAETLAFVFRHLNWDAEGDLAGIIGDIPAHRLARLGKDALSSVQASTAKMAENFAEYATQDSQYVVPKQQITGFSDEVNRLRDDLARLEKRVSRL